MAENDEVGMGDGLDSDELLGMDSGPTEGEDLPLDEPTARDGGIESGEREEAPASTESTSPEEPKAEGEAAAKEEEGAPAPEAEKAESGPSGDITGTVEVFGKVYPNGKAALHALKSALGSERAWQGRYEELESQFNELRERVESRPAEGPPVTREAATETASGDKAEAKEGAKRFIDSLDPKFLEDLANDPNYGPAAAIRYALSEMEKHVDKVVEGRLERSRAEDVERLKPYEEMVQSREEVRVTYEAFEKLAMRQNDDGSPTFPELQEDGDANFIQRATRRFLENEQLREMGELGAYHAVLAERDWNRYLASGLPEVTSEGIDQRLDAENREAIDAVTTSGGGGARIPTGRKETFETKLKRELLTEEGATKDSEVLGM